MHTKFEIRSFTHSWDNRGYFKNWSVSGPQSLFSKVFNGGLFRWTLRMYWPNLISVALPVPEIIAIEILGWRLQTPMLGKRWP